MTTGKNKHPQHVSSRDAFSSVAFWQLMSFILLLCFIWANEILDFPAIMFGAEHHPLSIYRGCLLSAAIITTAIVSIGHTYERQKAVIKKILMTCVYCHRVMHDDGTWEHVEEFFVRNYPQETERGACPDCEHMLHSVQQKTT